MATNIEVGRASLGTAKVQVEGEQKELKYKPFTQSEIQYLRNNLNRTLRRLELDFNCRHDIERIEIKLEELKRESK